MSTARCVHRSAGNGAGGFDRSRGAQQASTCSDTSREFNFAMAVPGDHILLTIYILHDLMYTVLPQFGT